MTRWRLVVPVLVAILLALLVWQRAHRPVAAFSDGIEIGPDTWEQVRELLPVGILERYRDGDYRNPLVDLDAPGVLPLEMPPDFRAASEANRGRFTLDDAGSIVEVGTGERPGFVEGAPFPDIDAADPAAGTKIIWNYFYAQWYRGNSRFLTKLVMLDRGGIERELVSDVRMRVLDGAPEARGLPNPHGLRLQSLALVVAPADLAGTVSLAWRYRDASPDSVWTYVPGLRRSRAVSPLNRSDGFLGSDISLDDGPFFDAKPETFTFRVLDRRDGLVLVDPFSLRGEAELIAVAGGGWRSVWKNVPQIGADDPAWSGVPWAPASAALARRSLWVIDARPRDPNYLYGRLELYLDAETWAGAWVLKFDRAGALIGTYQVAQGTFYEPVAGVWIPAGGIAAQIAENRLYDRATVARFLPRSPNNPADYRVPLAADDFSPDVLVRLGR
ncbi:MAG TPA: outer membrane lipoprotein-sorting protein [Candidatus Limnocylindria bacterium]|nr:outer membrane lipoprotein-sorting protein [Candidatus Limnocylindria bacterium]